MSGDESTDVNEVQQRLREIQRAKRGDVRWQISKHTAELALAAIADGPAPRDGRRSGKSRRRKRHKRLL